MNADERDIDARTTIATKCQVVASSGRVWHDMETTRTEDLDAVTDALQWLEQRGDAVQGFRIVRHSIYPSLILFEAKAPEESA